MPFPLIAYILLLSARNLGALVSNALTYQKVITSTFPSTMSPCLLQNLSISSTYYKSIGCANHCLQKADCRLFCIKGDECTLFSAWVTSEYNNSDQDFFGFTSCYTSWFFSNNLAPQVMATMTTPNTTDQGSSKAINGFFCSALDSCSVSSRMTTPWWKADLKGPYLVSEIIVKTRDDLVGFAFIEIRFGNSTSMHSNPLINYYMHAAPPAGGILTFQPLNPIARRYLSFQSVYGEAEIAICELQIIEA